MGILGDKYRPGIGTPDRPLLCKPAQRLQQAKVVRQLANRGRFASRDDEPIQTLQLPRKADFYRFDPHPTKHGDVFNKVALKGKDTNYHPRPAISSASGMLEICLPTMGSPKLRLTSARIYGSL